MKKFFSLILVAVLSLSPIYAFATEDAQALTPTTSETPTEAAAETPAPEVSTEAPATEDSTEEVHAQSSEEDGAINTDTPSTEQLNTDTSTDDNSDESKKTEEESSDTKTDDKQTDETSTGESTEDTEETDLKKDSEGELEDELEKDEKDKTSIPEHEHEFEYISNKDGTHTVKCISNVIQEKEDGEIEEIPCDYESVEECSYDHNGVCVYCEYVKPEEEKKFDPSVSLSISNDYCTIGESNPLICMSIAAEDYDVEYAQICFANYAHNNFINVGLAQGKYYDYTADDFVYTGSGSWYASPDITSDYATGKYTVRSVYIRSTTGESVHYSVESGNLPEGYQNYSIEVSRPTGMSLIRDMFSPSSNDANSTTEEPIPEERAVMESESPEPNIEEPVYDIPAKEETVVEEQYTPEPEVVVEEPIQEETTIDVPNNNQKIEEATKAEEPKVNETPKAEEPKVNETPKAEEPKVNKQPKTEEPKVTETETPKSSGTKNTNSGSGSSTSQNSNSNSILNFFKKLFGFK